MSRPLFGGKVGAARFDNAACRGATHLFFFQARGNDSVQNAKRCREICNACPALEDCKRFVLELEDGSAACFRFGIWAGMTVAEIRRYRRENRGQVAA